MNVTLIGSGNVATVLGRLIKSAGHMVHTVMSPNKLHAEMLANELGAKAVSNTVNIDQHADLYIIAVSDAAIAAVAETVKLPGKMVVHTCGAVPKNILQQISGAYGVLYPLQSLRKEAMHVPPIPLLVDGSTTAVTQAIKAFAETISPQVAVAGDAERLKLHLAAVIVSNFTNHLYAVTKDYCEKEAVDFSMLIPLILETAGRIKEYSPKNMQTGPAVRGDEATINTHLQLLNSYPKLQNMYSLFTKSIQELHTKEG